MNEQLRQLEEQINAELDTLAARLDMPADPDVLNRAKSAARLARQEAWLASHADVEPAPELIARIKAEIRGELATPVRSPQRSVRLVAWRRLTVTLAAAAIALAGLLAWQHLGSADTDQREILIVKNTAPVAPNVGEMVDRLANALPDELGIQTAAAELGALQEESIADSSDDLLSIMNEIDTWLADQKAPSGSSDAGTGRKGQFG